MPTDAAFAREVGKGSSALWLLEESSSRRDTAGEISG